MKSEKENNEIKLPVNCEEGRARTMQTCVYGRHMMKAWTLSQFSRYSPKTKEEVDNGFCCEHAEDLQGTWLRHLPRLTISS
jgi:hypothetical protein